MENDIWVVRIVTVYSANYEFYYSDVKEAEKIHKKIAAAFKELEKFNMNDAPLVAAITITDEFGIRQTVNLRDASSIILTNTESSAKTVATVGEANERAQREFGRQTSTGFQPGVVTVG